MKSAEKVAVKKKNEETFVKGLVDYMQGRVAFSRGDEYYAAFKE